MKIIVTGATGFIGSHLIRTLTQMGHDCLGMDDCSTTGYPGWIDRFMDENHNVQFVIGDEGDCTKEWNIFNVFKKFKPELVFNLAVKCLPHSLEFPLTNFMDNVTIARNVVQGASHADARIVHFSSSEVYGQAAEEIMNERHVLRPTTPYAASKIACDHFILSLHRTFDLDAVIVRPFNTYGPGQNENTYAAVIPKMIKAILNKQCIEITGDGTQTRDFNYVSDVVNAAIMIAEQGKKGEVYNVCSGKETSINDLSISICDKYRKLMKSMENDEDYKRFSKFTQPRPGDVMRHRGDASKLVTELGWKPLVNMEDGLRETIQWYIDRA